MSSEVKALIANIDAVYGYASGRDEAFAFKLTMTQVVAVLGVSAGAFFLRIATDPLVASQMGMADVVLASAIWVVWLAAISLVAVLLRMGGQGGVAVVGLCLAAAAMSVVEVLTPAFLMPVHSFILVQLGLAMYGLSLAFRMTSQIRPDGRAALWANRFGTHAMPACAALLFLVVTPVSDMAGSAGAYLKSQRTAVEAGRQASAAQTTPRAILEMATTRAAPMAAIEAPAQPSGGAGLQAPVETTLAFEPGAPTTGAVQRPLDQTSRAGLALLFLTVANSDQAVQSAW